MPAYQQAKLGLPPGIRRPKPALPKTRTPEEIMAQLEARYAELERQAQSPEMTMPCKDCRWMHGRQEMPYCRQPLVQGFSGREKRAVDGGWLGTDATLCGPEKALWEPRLSWWQRFVEWFFAPWRGE
jgi:hypothetical protein